MMTDESKPDVIKLTLENPPEGIISYPVKVFSKRKLYSKKLSAGFMSCFVAKFATFQSHTLQVDGSSYLNFSFPPWCNHSRTSGAASALFVQI